MKNKTVVLIVPLLALALAALACGPGGGRTLPLTDDFTQPNSGWETGADEFGTAAYGTGEFIITVAQPNASVWSVAGVSVTDVVMEVDARAVVGEDNDYGLACRVTGDSYYYFIVSADGYAGIALVEEGELSVISSDEGLLYPAEAVNTGRATNHLRAVCQGDNLVLAVNGVEVANLRHRALSGAGDLALVGGSFTVGGVQAAFAHFSASAP